MALEGLTPYVRARFKGYARMNIYSYEHVLICSYEYIKLRLGGLALHDRNCVGIVNLITLQGTTTKSVIFILPKLLDAEDLNDDEYRGE